MKIIFLFPQGAKENIRCCRMGKETEGSSASIRYIIDPDFHRDDVYSVILAKVTSTQSSGESDVYSVILTEVRI